MIAYQKYLLGVLIGEKNGLEILKEKVLVEVFCRGCV